MAWIKEFSKYAALSLVVGGVLVGCGGSDKAAETAAEKAMKDDGINANVDIDSQGGTMTITGTSEDGSATYNVSSEDGQTSTTVTNEQGTTEVHVGERSMVPSDFPGDFPIYNGFRPVSVVDSDEKDTFNVTGTVTDSAEDVARWYKIEMPRAGWTEENVMEVPGAMTNLHYKNGDRMANISITSGPTGTVLVLTTQSE